jgi:hypothetical protein
MSKEEWFSFIFLYFLCGVLWSRGGQCDEKDTLFWIHIVLLSFKAKIKQLYWGNYCELGRFFKVGNTIRVWDKSVKYSIVSLIRQLRLREIQRWYAQSESIIIKTHSKTIVLQDYSFYLLVFFLSLLLFTVPRCKTIVLKDSRIFLLVFL